MFLYVTIAFVRAIRLLARSLRSFACIACSALLTHLIHGIAYLLRKLPFKRNKIHEDMFILKSQM